jgi:hypothetical protein
LLIVATVGVLASLAVVDALRSGPPPSAAATAPTVTTSLSTPTFTSRFPFGSKRAAVEDIGNTWAFFYAAGDPKACEYMGENLCEFQPTPRFRALFKGATVRDIRFLNNHDAGAAFSNGIVVEFWGDGGTWTVVTIVSADHHLLG